MSIPKEPRQLMINLMYLVLTAMLALNVSAEIMNAFFDIDRGLTASNAITLNGINETESGLTSVLEKKKELREPVTTGISEAKSVIKEFTDYIESVKDKLIDMSGNQDGERNEGDYDEETHKIKGKKNKDATTRLFVTGEGLPGTKPADPEGPIIKAKIDEYAQKIAAVYKKAISHPAVIKEQAWDKGGKNPKDEIQKEMDAILQGITLKIDPDWKSHTKDPKKEWHEAKFGHMPVSAVLPLLTKFQTDAINSEALVVNKIAKLVGGKQIKITNFFPVIEAKKGYIIKGEKFEATLQIGAASDEFAKNSKIFVNGKAIPMKDGKGTFTETTSSTGKKTLKLSCVVNNPITGENFKGDSQFEYEVGVRSATVSADKMNVFYIGVNNPISVVVAGSPSNSIKVNGSGCSVTGSNGKYTVTATKPGEATINVSAQGFPNTPFKYRIKRIPDPVPMLGAGPNKKGGAMGNGEFKAQRGLAAVLEGFDFEAKCNVAGYELTRQAKRKDPISVNNRGARYGAEALRIVKQATPGDTYYFDNIKVKCPGDKAGRRLSSIVFKIR